MTAGLPGAQFINHNLPKYKPTTSCFILINGRYTSKWIASLRTGPARKAVPENNQETSYIFNKRRFKLS